VTGESPLARPAPQRLPARQGNLALVERSEEDWSSF
jgi:hypothetical protein